MSQIHHSHALQRPATEQFPARQAPRAQTAVAARPETLRRPLGLRLLPLAALAVGAGALLQAAAWRNASDLQAGSWLAIAGSVITLGLVAVAALQAVFAYGLVRLRVWTTRLGISSTLTALVLTLLSSGRLTLEQHTLWLLLDIGTAWYLLSPTIQNAFREAAEASD